MRKLTFASLQVRDLEASKEFYTTKLGFEEAGIPNSQACIFRYNQGEASFAIRTPLSDLEGKELGTGTSLWFAIDEEIEALEAQFIAREVPISGPIQLTPFGKILVVRDPDGYNLTFLKTS